MTACPKEQFPQSKVYSPGVVRNDEDVVRLLFAPDHVDQGRILESAFPRQDFLDRGFSVQRRGLATRESAERVRDGYLARNPIRQLHGPAVVSCATLRSIEDENGEQALCVTDDAREDDESHALIHCSKGCSKSKFAKLRRLLTEIFTVQSMDEVFGP